MQGFHNITADLTAPGIERLRTTVARHWGEIVTERRGYFGTKRAEKSTEADSVRYSGSSILFVCTKRGSSSICLQ